MLKTSKITPPNLLIIVAMVSLTFHTGCKKDLEKKVQTTPKSTTTENELAKKSDSAMVNPYSVKNIKQALTDLERNNEPLIEDRIYYYYKFNPQNVTGETLSKLEEDSTSQILDYPFADGDFYSEKKIKFKKDELESYKDGNLYIVYKATSGINTIFQNGANIGAEKLDELYLPKQEDEDLQIQALITARSVSAPNVQTFKLTWPCILKVPHGRVTYFDQEDGQTKGVPHIKVWATFGGIPIPTHTDQNGYYTVPWAFTLGSLIGTNAKNSRVEVKPLNTTGTFVGAALSIISNFIVGAQHTEGWFNACQMKKDINIHFGNHSQERYWAQILHAVRKHYDYTAQDGIHHAPTVMTIYAQWSNNLGVQSGSTPMLGHLLNTPYVHLTNLWSLLFGTNLSITTPNLYQLFSGLYPDMTMNVGSTQGPDYSEELMQTLFHELGHASYFHQVGQIYWTNVLTQIAGNALIYPSSSQNYPYGSGGEPFAGYIQVNEAWAEFIGKEHHRRFHPNGQVSIGITGNMFKAPYPAALENAAQFFNTWINTGIFYDLLDNSNPNITEPNDQLGGFTIQNMFNCMGPNTTSLCHFRAKFLQNNPTVNPVLLDLLMRDQNEFRDNCE